MTPEFPDYGLLAEFETADDLVEATRRIQGAGYRRFEAYSPFPVEDLVEAQELRPSGISRLVLCGGICGLCAGFGLQYWVAVIAYPLNIGGRPLNSWPAFIPVTFETTILFAALTAVLGMLALNGLPRPHHPLFGVDAFARVTQDRFFLCIQTTDPKFDANETSRFLESLHPVGVHHVPA